MTVRKVVALYQAFQLFHLAAKPFHSPISDLIKQQ